MVNINQEKPPAGNAALDQLELAAAAADTNAAAAANPAGDPAAPGAPDYKKSGAVITDMVVGMICGFEPRCAQYWPDETKARVAEAAGAVAEKYQFNIDAMPPELMLLCLAGPPLYQCSKLIAASMNNPQPQAGATAGPGITKGPAAPAGSGEAMVVHGSESGTVSHSAAMMDLKI